MNILKLTILIALFTSGSATGEGMGIVYGESSIKDIQEQYNITQIGHSSASRVEIYEVDFSDLKNEKCLFKSSLRSMTFNIDEKEVLVGSERIYKGNILAEMQACLINHYVAVKFTTEERTYFGPDLIKFQNSSTDVVVFFSGSENTTRYSANTKIKSESN